MSMPDPRAISLFGTAEPVELPRVLRAGPLSAELDGTNLRCVRWHGIEVVRAIQYLVRDENWGTLELDVVRLAVEEQEHGFGVSIEARCRNGEGSLAIRSSIRGTADGALVFEAEAIPDAAFLTNRCGFCILHPIVGVAGAPARLETVDGTVREVRFPSQIDPAQPFMEMRAITHWPAPGLEARCVMEGDTFEMEDQRNWSDASFKTYVRPLALPWPYTLEPGTPVIQRITLALKGAPAAKTAATAAGDVVTIATGEPIGAMPLLAVSADPSQTHAMLDSLDLLCASRAAHLIFHHDPLQGHGAAELAGQAELQRRSGLPATLEFVLPCRQTPEQECMALAERLRSSGLVVADVAISPAPDLKSTPPGSIWPDCPSFEDIHSAARQALPGMRLGGGMFSYFTELNRKRPPGALIDYVTHTTAPIVHAADDRSVMETLEALPFITGSVRAIYGEKPYRIGPSTIAMRHNPYGARLNDNRDGKRLTMTADDPRQRGLFAAAWMIGYAASVADAGLETLCLGALTGRFGVVEGGRPLPAFHALRLLGALSGATLRQLRSSHPSSLLALGDETRVVVANLSGRQITLEAGAFGTAAMLDERNLAFVDDVGLLDRQRPIGTELKLGAYGIAVLTREPAS